MNVSCPDCDNFTIIGLQKMGSITLENWAIDNNIPLTIFQELNFTRSTNYYGVWRPAYERIVTGLNTAFNMMAWKSVGEDTSCLRTKYMTIMDQFLDVADFDMSQEIQSHTHLIQYYIPINNTIQWFHISQLNQLHLFINKTYNTNFKRCGMFNRGDGYNRPGATNTYFVTVKECEERIKKCPKVVHAIAKRAAKDYIPKNLIDLNDL